MTFRTIRSSGFPARGVVLAAIAAIAAVVAVEAPSAPPAITPVSAAAAEEGAQPPAGGVRRVASLVPSVTEAVFALGASDRLVGVSTFCDFPPAAASLPRIGSYLAPNVEAIVALQPDVVIGVPTPGNRPAVEALRRLGLNVVLVGERTLADARDAIVTVGGWVGKETEARALVARLDRELDEVRARRAGRPPRRVLFVVGHDPLVVAGGGLFIDELIGIAGGKNVAADQPQLWPRLSLETAVAAAPDVIIDGAMGSEAGGALLAYWEPYGSIPAVRAGRVRAQQSDALLRPGPRAAEAARELEALVWKDEERPGGGASDAR